MAVSSPSNSPAYIRASWWIVTEPSAPSGLTTSRSRPRFSASGNVFCSYDGVTPVFAGMIQICRKCVVSVALWLNSECITPVPALIRCTSPGTIAFAVPIESSCASAPSST